jgi:similar to stage IV sporulation protein
MVGFSLFLAGWLVSSNMLLHIRIEGNYSISDDEIMDFLDEQGVFLGMWKKDISLEELEKEIRKKFHLVTWTSGKIDGTVLVINVKENEKIFSEAEEISDTYGSSIYASVDGIIEHIYVQYGVPVVKKGAEVKAGDMLVDGRVPVFGEDQTVSHYQYYEAEADIGIETVVSVEFILPNVYIQKEYTGRTNEGKCFFIGQKIYRNHWGDRNFVYKDLIVQKDKMVPFGKNILGYGIFKCSEYINVEKEYTKEDARKILEEEFLKNNIILIEKGVQILEENVTIEMIMKKWVLKGTMKVIMPAYENRPNEISEEIDDSTGI